MNALLAMRPRMFGIAYRILGSVGDAEDVVQSAFLRYSQHSKEDLRNPAGWLATVTARLAVDRARALARRREEYVGVWLPEPIVELDEDPANEAVLDDDLTIAFLHVLERLTPVERTALLLHDVFEYPHAEIAAILDKSEDAVKQLASRARARLRDARPRFHIDRGEARQLTERFLDALRDARIDELRAVLAADVVAVGDGGGKVNAGPRPVVGIDHVVRLFLGLRRKFWRRVRFERRLVNGLPGFVVLRNGRVAAVVGFDFSANRIGTIFVVLNPDKLAYAS